MHDVLENARKTGGLNNKNILLKQLLMKISKAMHSFKGVKRRFEL